jgi:hypothetical protein
MEISIAIIFSLIFFNSFSQESLVFENLELNENMRLIGMFPHYDDEKTFENYNFIIEDIKELDSITKLIRKGKEVKNQSTRNEFHIRLFDGDKKIRTWSFNPKYKYIRTDGKSYEFDASQILDLTEKFGFKYNFDKKLYQNKEQFDKDYENIKSDPKLLFIYEPDFKFTGTFEVKYIKSEKFKHPKAISEYLRKKIEKIKQEHEYRVYYVANDYNRNNKNQYTMTVESDFELFEWFHDKSGEKKEWIPNEHSATIFVKN